jgi:hypothetical protein
MIESSVTEIIETTAIIVTIVIIAIGIVKTIPTSKNMSKRSAIV